MNEMLIYRMLIMHHQIMVFIKSKKKEGNVLFTDQLNTFHLQLNGVGYMVKDHSVKDETHCHPYMGYSF